MLATSIAAVGVAKGAASSGSILTLVKGALQAMAWTKAKPATVEGIFVLFAAGIATVAVKSINQLPAYPAYTVQGIVELKSIRYSTNGTFYYDLETNTFVIYVKNGQWLAKLGSRRPEVYDHRIVSSDGANSYLLLNYETRQRMRVEAGQKPLNVGDGTVTSGTLPYFSLAPEAGAVWIAYASWCHFAENPDGRQRPVPFSDYLRPGGSVMPGQPRMVENASWQLEASPPHLPTALAYWVDGPGNADGLRPRGTGAPEVFTNVVYQSFAFLDFGGLRLPTESMVSIYRQFPGPPDSSTNQLCQQIRVRATNLVSGVELQSFQPKLPGKTIIADKRFNNGSGLTLAYFREDKWPSEPVARNSEAYKEAKARLAGGNEKFLPNRSPAPEILLSRLSGDEQKRLSDYKGKVVVLEFWATWCRPCHTTMQELQTYTEKYPGWRDSAVLITLNLDEDRALAASLVQREGWNRTENFWINHDVVGDYRFEGIPMVYILNQRGEIAAAGHDLDIPVHVNRLLGAAGP